jgi:GNAT superfamily N-acetyltransferase
MSVDTAKTNYAFPPPPEVEPITVRPATLADAPALALVGAATFLEAYSWVLPGADIVEFCRDHSTVAAYEKYLQRPDTRITLAVTGWAQPPSAPAGFAMVCAPDMGGFATQPGDLELKRIYLFSRFRSKATPVLNAEGTLLPGVRGGQALMDAAIASARELGGKCLLLGTNAGNERAIAFYRRNGFAEAGTRTFSVGCMSCCDLVFAKPL